MEDSVEFLGKLRIIRPKILQKSKSNDLSKHFQGMNCESSKIKKSSQM